MFSKNMVIKKSILVMFLILFSNILTANITVKSSVSDNKVGKNRPFNYTITVNTNSRNTPRIEIDMSHFPLEFSGPSTSTSQSMSFSMSGSSIETSINKTYTCYANKEGKVTIPKLLVKVNGKKYQTNLHKIEVVNAISLQKPNRQATRRRNSIFDDFFDDSFAQPMRPAQRDNDVFVEVEVSQDTVYFGQDVIATYRVYSDNRNRFGANVDSEEFDGYGFEYIDVKDKGFRTVIKNGKRYESAEVVKYKITPQKSGILTLPVVTYSESGFYGSRRYRNPTKKLFVKSLPEEGRSIDYSNGVGSFKISSTLSQNLMFDNQVCQLTVVISGEGNFDKIHYPTAPEVNGLEFLKPNASISVNENNKGQITLTYNIIPSASGKFEIPGVSFNYYDINNKKYKTIYSENQLLTVRSVNQNSQVNDKSMDVSFYSPIKAYHGTITKEYLLINQVWYWFLFSLIIVAIIVYLMVYYRNLNKLNDKDYMKKLKAKKHLENSYKLIKKMVIEEDVEFYSCIQNVLLKYISLVTGVSLQNSKQEIIDSLNHSYISGVTSGKIAVFLNLCEQIKYRRNGQNAENIKEDFAKFEVIYHELTD